MSEFSVVARLGKMKEIITECEKEAARFEKGINTSGTRVRKAMQEIKLLAQEIRAGISEAKAEYTPDPEKSARAKQKSPFCKK